MRDKILDLAKKILPVTNALAYYQRKKGFIIILEDATMTIGFRTGSSSLRHEIEG
jgi:hypothetical protein